MSLVNILIKEVQDAPVKKNFTELSKYLDQEPVLNGRFQHIDRTFTANETFSLTHTLGAVPQDVIQTFKTGSGTIVYNYESFTNSSISVTVSGASDTDPLRVRMLIGRV